MWVLLRSTISLVSLCGSRWFVPSFPRSSLFYVITQSQSGPRVRSIFLGGDSLHSPMRCLVEIQNLHLIGSES